MSYAGVLVLVGAAAVISTFASTTPQWVLGYGLILGIILGLWSIRSGYDWHPPKGSLFQRGVRYFVFQIWVMANLGFLDLVALQKDDLTHHLSISFSFLFSSFFGFYLVAKPANFNQSQIRD